MTEISKSVILLIALSVILTHRHIADGFPSTTVTSAQVTSASMSDLFSDTASRTTVLLDETQRLIDRLGGFYEVENDAGSCLQNSTIEDIKRKLETIDNSNDTAILLTASDVLAQITRVLEILKDNSYYSADITLYYIQPLESDSRQTFNNLQSFIRTEFGIPSPNVTVGLICQGATDGWMIIMRELVSISKGIKYAFSSLKSIFEQR